MGKRGKLEIIRDILQIVRDNRNQIKFTPLLRKSNISSSRFKEYFSELTEKKLIQEEILKNDKYIKLTDKGFKFLEKYHTILEFIEQFDL